MINPNDPANPQHGWSGDPKTQRRMASQGGLTKREWFAGMAMQGGLKWLNVEKGETHYYGWEGFAQRCLLIADALISELNKKP